MSQAAAKKQTVVPNPFAQEQAPRVQPGALQQQSSLHVRRVGIIPLAIGASKMVRGKAGERRIFTAREMVHELARAERDDRELTVSCLCFECRKSYASLDDLITSHPPALEMKENGEAHTYAFWSEDNYDAKGVENIAALEAELKALEAAHRSAVEGIAKLSDVEKIMAERKRCDEIKKMIEETAKKKRETEANIIGLMSETPPTV